MTKEQFYKNCFTEQGREKIEQEFNTPNTLKQYYFKQININDFRMWNEIVYIPKYGKLKKYSENYAGEYENYQNWEIYTPWDITTFIITFFNPFNIKINNNIRKSVDISSALQYTIYIYNNYLNGNSLQDILWKYYS